MTAFQPGDCAPFQVIEWVMAVISNQTVRPVSLSPLIPQARASWLMM